MFSSALLAAPPNIVVLGDSLSAGYGIRSDQSWVHLLQLRLKEQGYPHQVINSSISGETTHGGLTRLPRILANHRPDLLIIALGANDGLRGLSVKQMEANLRKMVQLGQKAGARTLLIGMQIPSNYGPIYTRDFRNAYKTVSDQQTIGLVPFLLEAIVGQPDLFQRDRLHPTAAAQPQLLDTVWPTVKKTIAALN
jgi:acyl-CoA thioesterase-1